MPITPELFELTIEQQFAIAAAPQSLKSLTRKQLIERIQALTHLVCVQENMIEVLRP
jgi:hypothetical protein